MQPFNFHTHTARCGHAVGSDEEYVLKAIEANMNTLGFSDHVPYRQSVLHKERMPYELKDDYLISVAQLKKKYEDKIQIFLGYEAEYFDEHLDELIERYNEVDYMILGQHNLSLDGIDLGRSATDEQVLAYASLIEKACATGLFTYLAHPDYFMLARNDFSEACLQASHRIIAAVKKAGMALECNMNGSRYGKKEVQGLGYVYAYPLRSFWEIVGDSDVLVIAGYDAHTPQTLLQSERYEEVATILEGINLNWIKDVSQLILR